jgi:allantoin racemase
VSIALVNPNTSEATTATMVRIAQAEAGARATVVGVTARFGAALITEPEALAVAAQAVAALAPELAEADAVIVAAFGDPGLDVLRAALPRPVTGLAEAGMAEAAAGGRRFAVVTTTPDLRDSIAATARRYGHAGFAGTWTTPGDPAALTADPPALLAARVASRPARRPSAEGGAEAIVDRRRSAGRGRPQRWPPRCAGAADRAACSAAVRLSLARLAPWEPRDDALPSSTADHVLTGFDAEGAAARSGEDAAHPGGRRDRIAAIGPAAAAARARIPRLREIRVDAGSVAIPGLDQRAPPRRADAVAAGRAGPAAGAVVPGAAGDARRRPAARHAVFGLRDDRLGRDHGAAPAQPRAGGHRGGAGAGRGDPRRLCRDLGMRASYSFALRDQNRMIYAADEEFVASLPAPLQKPDRGLPERLRPAPVGADRRCSIRLARDAGRTRHR